MNMGYGGGKSRLVGKLYTSRESSLKTRFAAPLFPAVRGVRAGVRRRAAYIMGFFEPIFQTAIAV